VRYFISLALAIVMTSAVFAEEKKTLFDFRYWTAPNHTRIVIDTEANTAFSISAKDNYVLLSVENAEVLSQTFSHLFFEDERIKRTQIKRSGDDIRLIFYTNEVFKVKHYTLAPNEKYKYHRLVIDLIDLQSKIAVADSTIEQDDAPERKIILVDAGHGGEDPGASGKNGSREKDVNLAIAQKLVATINQSDNMTAILTRSGDYYIPLTERITIGLRERATMFISIHADAVESSGAKGASIYSLSEKGEVSELAKQLEQSENSVDQFGGVETVIDSDQFLKTMLTDFSRKDRDIQSQQLAAAILKQMSAIGPVHKKTPQKANFVVLKSPAIPSVLVETAFISNPDQEARLNDSAEQLKIAEAIFQGIKDYYSAVEAQL
jgi:N-acetylmuramoyl-L-alanine amidase